MFEPVILKNINIPDSFKLSAYINSGGYQALKKALEMTPDALIQMVKDSGLRGRGGAGFSTGLKWSFIPKDATLQKYLCCNADEGEPGTFKDRAIIEYDPHQLVEGMIIASYAIGADTSYIYIRGEFAFGADRLEAAIKEAYQKNYLGKNILGSKFNHDMSTGVQGRIYAERRPPSSNLLKGEGHCPVSSRRFLPMWVSSENLQ